MIKDIFCALFLVLGTFFLFIAAIGLVRFPDLYLRMSATTKAATFGVGFNLLAAAIYFEDLGITVRALAALFFLFITAPVGAHLIGRAAYLRKVPLWEGSLCDELAGKYESNTGQLLSSEKKEH